ncbi:MAG: dpgD 1 [Mycobacterium sp.]|nr:dpgD 1 [Mycobacterium sp.]
METAAITFEVADHIATITLNRSAALNSFNDVMAHEIEWAWETIRDDDDIRVAVLQANGDRAFNRRGHQGWWYLVHEVQHLEHL